MISTLHKNETNKKQKLIVLHPRSRKDIWLGHPTTDEDNRLFADNTPLHSNDEDKREDQMRPEY